MMFEKMCEDGNMLVSLDEMNAIDICKKLVIVEQDPKKLWMSSEQVFGFGYFHPTIEEEFGITPAFKEQITKQFNEELNKARNEAQTKVNKFANQVKNELEVVRRVVGRKNQEFSLVHAGAQSKADEMLSELKKTMESNYNLQVQAKTRALLDRTYQLDQKVIALQQVVDQHAATMQ